MCRIFFGLLVQDYEQQILHMGGQNARLIKAKISKGENYRGLPYVVLDYPRQFTKTDIFAIRSFFWWGNFFSITLHLSGSYLGIYAISIQKAIEDDLLLDWYVCISQNQWEHHFEQDNYVPLVNCKYDFSLIPFLKLAKKIPLDKWDEATNFFSENFLLLTIILRGQAPIR